MLFPTNQTNNIRYIVYVLLLVVLPLRFIDSLPIYKDGDRVIINSRVTSDPVVYENSQGVRINLLKLYLPLYPRVSYGDSIVVEGVVEKNKLENPKLISITENKSILTKLRSQIIDFYSKSMPEPHSSLISGMTLGSKANIPGNFWDKLKQTGTAHVVVASGMNVSLVAGFLLSIFLLVLPRQKAIVASLAGIWFYALIAGLDPPLIRAAIMGTLALASVLFGRLNVSIRALVISAYLMLVINPQWIFDIGFLLSFSATLSLILFERKILKHLKIVPGIFREGLSTSISAQILVAPILFVTFGNFNILSPIVNALVIWTVPLITIIAMVAGLVGIVFLPLGSLILYLSYPLTLWFIGVVDLFS